MMKEERLRRAIMTVPYTLSNKEIVEIVDENLSLRLKVKELGQTVQNLSDEVHRSNIKLTEKEKLISSLRDQTEILRAANDTFVNNIHKKEGL